MLQSVHMVGIKHPKYEISLIITCFACQALRYKYTIEYWQSTDDSSPGGPRPCPPQHRFPGR
jgi:hypothetical protein